MTKNHVGWALAGSMFVGLIVGAWWHYTEVRLYDDALTKVRGQCDEVRDDNNRLRDKAKAAEELVNLTTDKLDEARDINRQEVEAELLKRWNTAVAAAGERNNYLWQSFDNFPHPTYKGGSDEAYAEFAKVLSTFVSDKTNVDFARKNGIFDIALKANGVTMGFGKKSTTLKSLCRMLSNNPSLTGAQRQTLSSLVVELNVEELNKKID